jgi:hypothetical protein
MLDLALSFDANCAGDCLGPFPLLGSARDPFAVDLEPCEPDLAVALQVDVQTIVNLVFVYQLVHRLALALGMLLFLQRICKAAT